MKNYLQNTTKYLPGRVLPIHSHSKQSRQIWVKCFSHITAAHFWHWDECLFTFFSFIYAPGHATRSCKVYNVFTKKSLGGFYLVNLCLHLCQPVLQHKETFCFVCSCLAHWLIFDLHTAQLEISPIPIQNPLSQFFVGFHYCSWTTLLKHLFDWYQGRRKKHTVQQLLFGLHV